MKELSVSWCPSMEVDQLYVLDPTLLDCLFLIVVPITSHHQSSPIGHYRPAMLVDVWVSVCWFKGIASKYVG